MPTETLDPRRQQNVMTDKIDNALETRTAKVMTLEEVSRYLHVHPSTVYRLLKRREIPAFRIGSDWRFNIETIDTWRSKLETSR
jgi:excisionase family DNA binding protein